MKRIEARGDGQATGYRRQATARSKMSFSGLSPLSRWLALASIGLLCTACGSLFESDVPPPSRYVIAAAPPAAAATQSAASQTDLSIGRPDVAPGLDTERVAVLRGRQLDYFRAAQWGGSVVEIVQALLVSSFQDQQLFRSVTSEQARVSSDYMLDVEVRDFQAEYTDGNTAPSVHVTLVGRIIRIADRELVDTILATAQRPASENRMSTVAAAFEAAAQQVALELAKKAAAAIASDKVSK